MLYNKKSNKTCQIIDIYNLIIFNENVYLSKACKMSDFINILFQFAKAWFNNFNFWKYRKKTINIENENMHVWIHNWKSIFMPWP